MTELRTAGSHHIPVVGVVGGIGSGKSALTRWMAEHHPVAAIDADRIGHQALQQAHVVAALRQAFGAGVRNAQGEIDRSALAQRVFGDSAEQLAARAQLEAVVHPEIQREIERQIAAFDSAAVKFVLLDAAVLLESNWRKVCDAVVFIDTPAERRQAWVEQHRGWSANELARREASQWPLEKKRAAADAVVVNDGTVEAGGQKLWQALLSLQGHR